MFKIMSYIYLDNFNQSYKKIIIINSNPNDSNINEIIKIIPRKKNLFLIILQCMRRIHIVYMLF